MEKEEAHDIKDFNAWWENKGSKGPDINSQTKLKAREAWLNGASKAREKTEHEYERRAYEAHRRAN